MMQFNPLFFNINQTSPELSKPGKLGSISYLFSDIIKVLLNENSEEEKIADNGGSTNNELGSVLNLLRKNLTEVSGEKQPGQLTGRKFKISVDETPDFSIQALFSAAADSLLDKKINISIKKDPEKSIRKIELCSEIPEAEAVKTISAFLENLHKNSEQIYEERIPVNRDLLKISAPIYSQEPGLTDTEMKISKLISSFTENDSVKFKLESPEEFITVELSKPSNSNPVKPDQKEIKIFNGFPEPESNFKLQINYAKISLDEQFEKPEDSSFKTEVSEKLLSTEQDNPEEIFSRLTNPEDYKNTSVLRSSDEKIPVINLKNAFGTPVIKGLNEEIKFKLELLHKEPAGDEIKFRDSQVSKIPPEGTAGSAKDSTGSSGLPKTKQPVFFNFEISKGKESSLKHENRMPSKSDEKYEEIKTAPPAEKNENKIMRKYTEDNESAYSGEVKQEDISRLTKNKIQNSVPADSSKNDGPHLNNGQTEIKEIKTVPPEETNKNEIIQKYSRDDESTHSDQLKQEEASKFIKNKVQNSIPDDSNKNSGIHLNTGPIEIKEIPLKENLPLPFLKSGEMKHIPYPNLTEEISRIIKDNEIKSVTLKLEPEDLGKVKIVVEMISSGIKANIEVTNEAVRQSMQSNLEQLKENLIHQGVQLNSLNVTLNNNEQKPVKTFNQKKPGYSKHSPDEELHEVENREAPGKKLGYNTYEYLI